MFYFGISLRPSSTSISTNAIAKTACKMLWRPAKATCEEVNAWVHPGLPSYEQSRAWSGDVRRREESLGDIFVSALVKAGSCRHCASGNAFSIRSARTPRRHGIKSAAVGRRQLSTTPSRYERSSISLVWREEPEPERRITKEQAKELVNLYETPQALQKRLASRQKLAPRLFLTAEQEDRYPYKLRDTIPPIDAIHKEQIRTFIALLVSHNPGYLNHDKIWEQWQALPSPRVRYITDETLRRLLKHLGTVEFKTSPNAMTRFLSVLDECLGEKVVLTELEWNSAIAFTGGWVRDVSSSEVKSAVEMWMRMEDQGVQATNATFNILFDIAVKAERYALADMIYAELKARGMELNRFFRTSMIYYAGSRGDGDAVRAAFNDLVDAGEIVDTVIMNCVIVSLIRAGEGPAAEHIFEKMKRLYAAKLGTQSLRSWQKNRELGHTLDETARLLRKEKREHQASFFGGAFSQDHKREEIQRASPIAPNVRTYRALVKYHVLTTGDIQRVQELLAEMKVSDLHIDGSFYTWIIRGFGKHGGLPFTAWRTPLLEAVWKEFIALSSYDLGERPTAESDDSFIHGNESDGSEENLFEQSTEAAQPQFSDYALPFSDEFLEPEDLVQKLAGPIFDEPSAADSLEQHKFPDEPREGPKERSHQEGGLLYSSEEDRAPYFTHAIAKSALRSFYACAGCERMLEVWDEIQIRWADMPEKDRQNLQYSVDWMKNHDSAFGGR